MVHSPQSALAALIERHGVALARDPRRCTELLGEALGDRFAEEREALVAAAEHGVPNALLEQASPSEPKANLLGRLSRQLAAEAGLPPYLARWSVECWGLALGAVPDSERLLIGKLNAFAPILEAAVAAGALGNEETERLVREAEGRGIATDEARGFIGLYDSRRRAQGDAAPAPGPVAIPADDGDPAPEPPAQPARVRQKDPRAALATAASPRPGHRGRYVLVALASALAAAIAFVTLVLLAPGSGVRPPSPAPPSAAELQAQREAEAQAQREAAAEKEREAAAEQQQRARAAERQRYETARGNVGALRDYVRECRFCEFADEAHRDIAALAAAEDERGYRLARGNVLALRAYVLGCNGCAYRSAALAEIARLEAAQQPPPPPQTPPAPASPDFVIYAHRDLPDNDLLQQPLRPSSANACAAACTDQPMCKAYMFDRWNEACFLKTAPATLILNPKATTAVRRDAPQPALSDQAIHIDRHRRKAFLENDGRATAAASLPACEADCLTQGRCMAYTFFTSRQQCLLFDDPGTYSFSEDAVSGVKVQPR